ncbi:hypothetical protein C8Q75DRAFT_771016 [Abortiporus biennis]|nr:hypothetical protein C8Q75DRAFT_771016 [Abortiporus biennis]
MTHIMFTQRIQLQVPPPNSNSDLNNSLTHLSEKAAGKKKKKDSEHERASHWLVSKEAIEADKMRVSKHFLEEQRQFEAWARMQTRGVEEYLNSIPEDQIDLRSQLTESLERLKGVNAILYQQLVSMENDSNH